MPPFDPQVEIKKIWQTLELLQSNPILPDHFHNRYDASPVNFKDIYQKKIYIDWSIPGTSAATATNYGVFWIAPVACYVSNFYEVHQTAGSDGGTVTVTLEKLTGTTAPDSGSVVLGTALSLKATANTVQTGTLTTTLSSKTLAKGDRLCLKDAGVLTAVANVTTLTEITVI